MGTVLGAPESICFPSLPPKEILPVSTWTASRAKEQPIPWVLINNGNRRDFPFLIIIKKKKKTNNIEPMKNTNREKEMHAEDPELSPLMKIIWYKNQHKLGIKASSIYNSMYKPMIWEQKALRK